MVNLFEVLPVLALALAVVFIPLLGDGSPPGPDQRSRPPNGAEARKRLRTGVNKTGRNKMPH